MGSFNAGVWFIVVSLYFILFIAVVSSVQTFSQETGIEFTDGTTANGSIDSLTLSSQPFCDTPRVRYGSDGSSSFQINPNEDDCSLTNGILNQQVCEGLVGCSWQNITTGFWFFSDTKETCIGTLNASYYGKDDTNNFCTAPVVSSNATICIRMGCLMYTTEPLTYDITSPKQLFLLVTDLFSFRYDFGFDDLLNILLTIILIFIPLLIWLMALYYMIPFFH
jgi:hypothetical protein